MFTLLTTDGRARRTRLETAHGIIETPVFMNVGTTAAIRGGASADDLKEIGCQVELSNTYHLHLQPGEELVERMGGLHKFMNWQGPMLTDSGGFQVFSLKNIRKITEAGASFTSYLDGRKIFMGPEESMRIQSKLGADIAMAFDECIENPAPRKYVERSVERTVRWLKRCIAEHNRITDENAVNPRQMLFGINQGGVYDDIRVKNMKDIADLPLDGFAIGGLSVGESAEDMYRIIDAVEPYMPKDKPRYLMGVGTPVNILEAVNLGIDFFDCVLPLRNAQHGNVFTWEGRVRILAEKYKYDPTPISENCSCPACRSYSKAYIRHLIKADERLGMRLCVLHNLYFYNDLMSKMREAIEEHRFGEFYLKFRDILDRRN
ncbi:MAG: tRNA guanosine(34) transglycosylase Tgt [Christensenellaceae bacterium]|nr:tRNA guanosine(34) transglycosylase Tgt [Christensenellaceae bacterium]